MRARFFSAFRFPVNLRVFVAVSALVGLPAAARAQCTPPVCWPVTDTTSLNAAISGASSQGGVITFFNDVTLTSNLSGTLDLTQGSVVVEGNGFTLSGGGTYQGLTITNFDGFVTNTATINNLTIANTVAQGGNGLDGAGGGGGGAGLGGGLFIDGRATVLVSNVNLVFNSAFGGAGGVTTGATGPTGGDGGGLNGGSGGSGDTGFGAVIGQYGAGGGGGATGASGPTSGATSLFAGGAGGSADGTSVAGGFGGGSNNGTSNGGGGGAMGGAVFIQSGGRLQVVGSFTVNGSAVRAGSASGGASSGSAFGSGLYLDGSGSLSFATSSNINIAAPISDGTGSGNSLGGSWSLNQNGTGTLVLSGNNSYSGGTTITAGTVSVSSNTNLGTGSVNLSGGTLALTGSDVYTHTTSIGGTGTLRVSPGVVATWNAPITDAGFVAVIPGALNVTGGGTLVLGNNTNSYSLGTYVFGNSTVSINADGALGATGSGVTLGDGTTSGTLAITTSGLFSSTRPITLGAGGGTIDTASATLATLGGNITGSGGLTKSGAGSLTLTGANSYTGPTTVGAGTLLAGSSSAFGSSGIFSIASGATLDFNGFSQTMSSLAGAGTLLLSGGASMNVVGSNGSSTFGGVIGGTGGITKGGSGTLTLTGTSNTFSGGVNLFGGTLAASPGALGTGTISVANGTVLSLLGSGTFSNNLQIAVAPQISVGSGNTVAWNGAISDFGSSGAVQLTGGGTLVLANGANSYSGGTSVAGGSTVQVGSDGALGAAGATVSLGDQTSSGTLAITGSLLSSRSLVFGAGGATINTSGGTSATFTGSATGAGGLTKAGGGTLTLGPSSYAGQTVVVGGTLRAGSTNAFGGGLAIAGGTTVDFNGFNQTLGSLSGNGTLALGGGSIVTLGSGGASDAFGGSLIGSGRLVKNGGGTLTLTGSNSYAGGTTVNGGVLLGNASSIQGNVVNNAAVVFDQAGSGTYAGAMSGSGSLTKNGSGTLTLSGTNTYGGGTFVNSGTLIGTSTSLQGTIVNNGSLVFDQSGTGTFNGTIFGTGTLTKTGAGTLAISGTDPFSGTVSVAAGTLALNGSFAGSVNIAQGADLIGTGTIGGSLNLDGTLVVPGAGGPATTSSLKAARRLVASAQQTSVIPSIVIDGNLTAAAGSVLDFTVTPNGTAPIVVNGLATLTSPTVNVTVDDPSPARNASYVGLASGGLTVNNTIASGSSTPGIVPVIKYDPKYLYVTVLNENIPLGGVVTSPNAAGAGSAIDRIKFGATGDLAFVVRELTALGDQGLDTALRQIAGELHATELRITADEAVAISDLVRDAIADRQDEDTQGGRRTTGTQSMRWWFQLTGDHGHFSPAGFDSAVANTGGGGGGFDFRPTSSLTLGGGGSFSLADMSMLGLGGSSNMQTPRAFGYAGYTAGSFGFNGGASTARVSYATRRPIAFLATIPAATGEQPLTGGIDRQADSDQTGVVKDTWTELKDTLKRGGWVYNWKIGWRAASYDRNPFTENGAGALSLLGLAQVFTTREADVNIHAFRRTGTWRPRVLVAYRRQLGDLATNSNLQIGDQPAGRFVVEGVPLPQDEFHGIFGLTYRSGLGMEYTLEYETRQAKDETHNAVHFRVRFK